MLESCNFKKLLLEPHLDLDLHQILPWHVTKRQSTKTTIYLKKAVFLLLYLAEVQGRSRWDHSTAHVRGDHLSTNYLLPSGQQCILGLKVGEYAGGQRGGGLAVCSWEAIVTPTREDSGWTFYLCSGFIYDLIWIPQTSVKRYLWASVLSDIEKVIKNNLRKFSVWVTVYEGWPAVSMVTPAMSVAHVRTLLANVDVIQGPLILLSIVVLDPTEPCGTGPEHTHRHTHTDTNC